MDKMLSIRRNLTLTSLFLMIQEYQQGNRTEIVNAAIKAAAENAVDWKSCSKYKVAIAEGAAEDSSSEFLKIRVDEEEYHNIREQIYQAFPLNERLSAPFVIKLVLINYLLALKAFNEDILTGEKKQEENIDIESFKALSTDQKLNVIYEKLIELINRR